jgi:hypothetical protein
MPNKSHTAASNSRILPQHHKFFNKNKINKLNLPFLPSQYARNRFGGGTEEKFKYIGKTAKLKNIFDGSPHTNGKA